MKSLSSLFQPIMRREDWCAILRGVFLQGSPKRGLFDLFDPKLQVSDDRWQIGQIPRRRLVNRVALGVENTPQRGLANLDHFRRYSRLGDHAIVARQTPAVDGLVQAGSDARPRCFAPRNASATRSSAGPSYGLPGQPPNTAYRITLSGLVFRTKSMTWIFHTRPIPDPHPSQRRAFR